MCKRSSKRAATLASSPAEPTPAARTPCSGACRAERAVFAAREKFWSGRYPGIAAAVKELRFDLRNWSRVTDSAIADHDKIKLGVDPSTSDERLIARGKPLWHGVKSDGKIAL
jgi:hypothetical protein